MTKILKTFGGTEYVLDDDEAQNIVDLKRTGKKSFIELRCGAYIDSSAIESVAYPPLIPVSGDGYSLSKDGRSFVRDGIRIWVEHPGNVRYVEDPRYNKLAEAQFEIAEAKKEELPENPQESGLRSGKINKLGDVAGKKYGN